MPFPIRFLPDFAILPFFDGRQSSSFGNLADLPFIPFPLGDGDGIAVVVGATVRLDEPFPFPLLFDALDGIFEVDGTKDHSHEEPIPIIPLRDILSTKCVEDGVFHVSLRYSFVKISSRKNTLF